jgi:hypothetical protein
MVISAFPTFSLHLFYHKSSFKSASMPLFSSFSRHYYKLRLPPRQPEGTGKGKNAQGGRLKPALPAVFRFSANRRQQHLPSAAIAETVPLTVVPAWASVAFEISTV